MIYTITFNPSLDYVMKTQKLEFGHTNRSYQEHITVGGKGINVSLVLAQFGIGSTALGFVGGFTGDQLDRMIKSDLVKTDFVRVANGNTRINVKLIENEMTEINAGGPLIDEKEIETLLGKLDALEDGDTLIIGGSIPKGVTDDIYERILERISGRNVRSVVDAMGALLLGTLKYRPFLIKPNVDELSDIFKAEITCDYDVIKYALKLREMGAENVLVSMGKDGAILIDENGGVTKQGAAKVNAVNPVGAGDSMVAGFIAGAQYDYKSALIYGTAAGGATACSDGLADKATIDELLAQIIDR